MYKRQEKWCDSERYFKSESYCERKREVEIFKISRDYEEFMGRLEVEMIYNKYNKYLPWVEACLLYTSVLWLVDITLATYYFSIP